MYSLGLGLRFSCQSRTSYKLSADSEYFIHSNNVDVNSNEVLHIMTFHNTNIVCML